MARLTLFLLFDGNGADEKPVGLMRFITTITTPQKHASRHHKTRISPT